MPGSIKSTEFQDIVSGSESGGTHTSRTIMLSDLRALLSSVPADSSLDDYTAAVLEENVLGKTSLNSRKRSLRYLKELFLLDPDRLLFRSLRDVWELESEGQPLIAMLSALARDPTLRATASVILPAPRGQLITSHHLEEAVQARFDDSYSDPVANKIGRNAASSWTQSGHLEGRSNKKRKMALATPASTAYALLLGHLEGERGLGLFSTVWAKALDATDSEIGDLASAAATRSWIEYKRFGDVIEVGFKWLLRSDGEAP